MSDGYRYFLHPETIAHFESLGFNMSHATPMATLPRHYRPEPTATTEGVRKVLERLAAQQPGD